MVLKTVLENKIRVGRRPYNEIKSELTRLLVAPRYSTIKELVLAVIKLIDEGPKLISEHYEVDLSPSAPPVPRGVEWGYSPPMLVDNRCFDIDQIVDDLRTGNNKFYSAIQRISIFSDVESNARDLVKNESVRDRGMVCLAAALSIPGAEKFGANVIRNLSRVSNNKVQFARRPFLMDGLITALSSGQPDTVEYAAATIADLTVDKGNRPLANNSKLIEGLQKALNCSRTAAKSWGRGGHTQSFTGCTRKSCSFSAE